MTEAEEHMSIRKVFVGQLTSNEFDMIGTIAPTEFPRLAEAIFDLNPLRVLLLSPIHL